eukprot:TRINITY_DN9282_c0_g3_i4.p1 TRINITY_DN9282_c0_g3~~TRINITY_DN9282_c0_g3_i4.p1  ORF type:complete len:756 (+),score=232.35 TRINITY_DN9282_c0_g3_i4:37-2268(+)
MSDSGSSKSAPKRQNSVGNPFADAPAELSPKNPFAANGSGGKNSPSGKVEELQVQLKAAKQEIEDVKAEWQARLDGEVGALKATLDATKAALQDTEAQLEATQSKSNAKNASGDTDDGKLKQLVADKQNELEQARQAMDMLQERTAASTDSKIAEKQRLEAEANRLEATKYKKMAMKFSKAKKEAEAKLAAMEQELADAKAAGPSSESAHETGDSTAAVEAAVAQAEEAFAAREAALTEQVQELTDKVESLEKQNAQLSADAGAEDQSARVSELEQSNMELQSQLTETEAKLAEMAARVHQADKDAEAADADAEKYKEELAALASKHQEEIQSIEAKHNAELETLQSKLKELESTQVVKDERTTTKAKPAAKKAEPVTETAAKPSKPKPEPVEKAAEVEEEAVVDKPKLKRGGLQRGRAPPKNKDGDEGEINPIAAARASLKRRQPKAKTPEATEPIPEDDEDTSVTQVSNLKPSELMRGQTSGPTAQAAPGSPQVRRSVRIDSLNTAAASRTSAPAAPAPKKEPEPAEKEPEVEVVKSAEAPAEMGGVKLRTSPSRTQRPQSIAVGMADSSPGKLSSISARFEQLNESSDTDGGVRPRGQTMPSKKKGWQPPKNDSCKVCGKAVYAMEKLVADKVTFHKQCFRCHECQRMLSLGNKSRVCMGQAEYDSVVSFVVHTTTSKAHCCRNALTGGYAALEGHEFCKPCFKKLFKLKGNYSEGFGKEQHKKKWLKPADAPAEDDSEA